MNFLLRLLFGRKQAGSQSDKRGPITPRKGHEPRDVSRLGQSNGVWIEALEQRLLLTGTLGLDATADVSTVAHGGTVNYRYDITYAGAAGVTEASGSSIIVSDNTCSPVEAVFNGSSNIGDADQDGNVDEGETWRYSCTFTVPPHSGTETDPIISVATVTGNDVNGDAAAPGNDSVSVDITHSAGALAVTKSAGVTSVGHGSSITYAFDVRYTPGADGSPAQNIVLTDAKCDAGTLSAPSGDTNANGLLDGGEIWRYTCTHAVAAAHSTGEEDPIVNSATVSGQDLDGDPVTGATSNSPSVNVVHTPGTLTIVKSADRTAVPHGGTVTYTFNVTYAPGADGSPAQNIVVTDPRCSAAPTRTGGDTNSNSRLDSGETWTYTCSFTVAAAHTAGETDPITNTATVSGQDLDGEAVTGDTSNAVSVDLAHAIISGRKFLDLDADGLLDDDEPGLRAWTINLFRDTNGNGTLEQGTDALLATQLTGAGGNYSFADLVAGTYFVREVVRVGFTQTTPAHDLTLIGDESRTSEHFGNHMQGAALIPDPNTAGLAALLVVGTQSSDKISLGRDRRTTSTTVTLNHRLIGFYNPNGSIFVYGLRGDDQISTHPAISRPIVVHGGEGDDHLEGGASHDVLIGNDGRDTLNGRDGRDVLIGGKGLDQLNGSRGDDLLVAGRTDFDGQDDALSAILAEWKSNRVYDVRVNNLRDGSGGNRLNGNFFLDGTTTHDDDISDSLTGGADVDWFLARRNGRTADHLKDRMSGESVDSI